MTTANVWVLILVLTGFVGRAQQMGCTDPQAINFSEEAEVNDGSCTYPFTAYEPEFVAQLPDEVIETSGLIMKDGILWTHNDSGGEPVLFALDTSDGTLIRSLEIGRASNRDWEEITRDDTHAFIGDFGNNVGNRRDLKIYVVPLSGFEGEEVEADTISFDYPDQQDFSSRPQNHDFDMEAMVALGDSLYLFSKNWSNQKTRLYRLPKVPGHYTAELIDSFEVNGLITGAAFSEEDSLIILTGYTRLFTTFSWMLWDFKGHDIFSGNKRRIELGIPFHQLEAACWNPHGKYFFLSNERFSNIVTVPARLHKMYVDQWLFNPISGTTAYDLEQIRSLDIYPNPATDSIHFDMPFEMDKIRSTHIFNAQGQVMHPRGARVDYAKFTLDIQDMVPGVYFIHIRDASTLFTGRFVKL